MTSPSSHVPPPPTAVVFTPMAFAGATGMFVVFGAVASLYGPLLDTFAHHFGVSLPAAGAVVSVHFAGALCGVPLAWVAMRRFTGPLVLASALGAMALGTTAAAFSPGFASLLASIFVVGLSFGALDFLLNSLLVRTAAKGRAHRVSVANAGYGVGSVIGPLLVIVARPAHYPLILAGVGLGALALTTSTRGVRAPAVTATHLRADDPLRRTKLTTFVLAYVLYVATEASLSGWIAPQVHRIGNSEAVGAAATAGFWLGLAAGRFAAGPAHRIASPRRLVVVGLGATVVLCLAARVDALAPFVYPVSGLSMALVYPMGLIWYTELSPRDDNGIALMILLMMAGGVIGPALTSVAVSAVGIRAVPFCTAGWALVDLAVFASARRFDPLEPVGRPLVGEPPPS